MRLALDTRPVRFLAVGVAATLTHGGTFLLLTAVAHVEPFYANLCAALLAALVSYFGHKVVTFRSDLPHAVSAPKFIVQGVVSWLVTSLLVTVLVPLLGVWLVTFIVMAVIPVMNYFVYQRWTFRL